jgi:flagellar basal-body rod modification protein FlgD
MSSILATPITNSSTSAATTTATDGSSTSSRDSIAGDFNSFLTLLTTQLKYQDPLSPMDTTQFTQQLAMFANVEQTSNVNTNMKSLISLTKGSQAASAIGYIGKTVQVDNPTAALDNGQAKFPYSLAGTSTATALVVSNALGRPVFATAGETGSGSHNFVWNGQDKDGNALPAGNYTLAVSAVDKNGAQISATVGSLGVVDGVDSASDGTVNVVINGVEVPLSKVVSVQN